MLGQDGQQVLVKHGGVYVRVHPCRLSLENLSSRKQETSTTVSDVSTQVDTDHRKYERSNSDYSSSDESDKATNDDNEQNDVEVSLSPQSTINNQNDNPKKSITLKKGMHVRYKVKDDEDNWYSAKLISRSGKATGKYKNEWNVENDVDGKHVVDFDCVDNLEEFEADDETAGAGPTDEMFITEILKKNNKTRSEKTPSEFGHTEMVCYDSY